MKSLLLNLVRTTFVAGLCLSATLSAMGQDNAEGIVRISKPRGAGTPQVTQASFGHHRAATGAYNNCDCQNGTDPGNGTCPTGYPCNNGCNYGCNTGCNDHGRAMIDYFRCKFGYFIPTGAGGAGVPCVGKYARVYPQDPYYFDQRDGQTYGAQGYGMPMAVPLAPVVGHTYNYGWGIPSSRLTPISHPAY